MRKPLPNRVKPPSKGSIYDLSSNAVKNEERKANSTYKLMDIIQEDEEPSRERINTSSFTSGATKKGTPASFMKQDDQFPIMNNKALNIHSFQFKSDSGTKVEQRCFVLFAGQISDSFEENSKQSRDDGTQALSIGVFL